MDHGTDFTEGCGETAITPSGAQGGGRGGLTVCEGEMDGFYLQWFCFSEEAVDEAAASIRQAGGVQGEAVWGGPPPGAAPTTTSGLLQMCTFAT